MTEILRNSGSDGIQTNPFTGDVGIKSRSGPPLPVCVGCGFIIRDPYILRVSPNLEWHGTCLKCFECNQFLDESCTCFVKNGKAYCKRDYLKLFGIKCYRCQQPFSRNDLVMRARNFIYHTRCFSCFQCHKPLTPGDEFYLKGPDQSLLFCNRHDPEALSFESRDFTELDPGAANQSQSLMEFMQGPPGQQRLLESIGSACNGLDGFGENGLTANGFDGEINGRRHHKSAQDEEDELSNSPRYTQNDGRSTTPHKSLDGALLISSPSDRDVSGATSYLDRMTTFCKSADAMTSSANGDDVGDDNIVNDDDDSSSEDVNQMTSSPTSPVSHFQARRSHTHGYRGAGLGRGAKQHHNHHHSQHHFGHRDHLHHGSGAGGSTIGGDKVTRVRTVLNEKQLHTLRTCYNANPRPDALMKEQLVEMTGLSPRVIRVWFQNKRCKDKKRQILMKQITQAQEKGIANMHGIPMVASSPVRHEQGPFNGNYMEIQTYHSPWKALNDFALQNEIDSQPFQQLI